MYIFLDVDGVLNTKADWKRMYSLNSGCVEKFNKLLSIIDNPKIVLSSTWRNGIARDGSTATHIDDLIRALNIPVGMSIDKTAVSPDGYRDKEINHYLRRHPMDDYIILDDDVSIFEKGKNTSHLYIIDSAVGFTETDYVKIRRLIGRSHM